jgi:hypothetical protein
MVSIGVIMIGAAIAMVNYAIYALFGTIALNVFVVVQIVVVISSLVWFAVMTMLKRISDVVINAHRVAVDGIIRHQAGDDMGEMARISAQAKLAQTMMRAESDRQHEVHSQALALTRNAQAIAQEKGANNDKQFMDMMSKAFGNSSVKEVR